MIRAAPERIPSWDARQYLQDVRSGNSGAVRHYPHRVHRFVQWVLRASAGGSCPDRLRIKDGRRYPFIEGNRKRTPVELLNLQPGELVRVKSKEEIVKTLDTQNANRGMSFDGEMRCATAAEKPGCCAG